MENRNAENAIVKTTVRLPRRLHLAARKKALDDGIDYQEFVARAIEQYLKFKGASR